MATSTERRGSDVPKRVAKLTDVELLGDPTTGRCPANAGVDQDLTEFCVLSGDHVGPCVGPSDVRAFRERKLDELVASYERLGRQERSLAHVVLDIRTIRNGDALAEVARELAQRLEDATIRAAEQPRKHGGYSEPYALSRMFAQGRYWLARGGVQVDVDGMSTDYKLNTARYLLWRASTFARAYWYQQTALVLGAPDDVAAELERDADAAHVNPVTWLVNTELFRALTGRGVLKLRRRQRLGHRCAASAVGPECLACRHQACGFCPTCEPAVFGGLFDDVL